MSDIPVWLADTVHSAKITNDKRLIQIGHNWVGIIIHHTDIGNRDPNTVDEATWRKLFSGITNWLTAKDENYLSAHFHIGRFGECAMLANPDTHITYHAGVSSYFHPITRKLENNWNSHAIGIELLGDGNKGDFSIEQYLKCAKVCAALLERYPTISPTCIIGHEAISPGRKTDPGKKFNWRLFFKMIYKNVNGE